MKLSQVARIGEQFSWDEAGKKDPAHDMVLFARPSALAAGIEVGLDLAGLFGLELVATIEVQQVSNSAASRFASHLAQSFVTHSSDLGPAAHEPDLDSAPFAHDETVQ